MSFEEAAVNRGRLKWRVRIEVASLLLVCPWCLISFFL